MSDLQEQTRPHLVPLLQGTYITFHRRGKSLLSAWATMLTIISEYVDHEFVITPPQDRSQLWLTLLPPSHWKILLARLPAHINFPDFGRCTLDVVDLNMPQTDNRNSIIVRNTQTTTFRVGDALFHVMNSSVPVVQRNIRIWKYHGLGNRLAQLWPITTELKSWPCSPLRLGEAALLSEAYYKVIHRPQNPHGI
jgi:hypothetical protein